MAFRHAHPLSRAALVSWLTMVGLMAVSAAVKWNQPGFRDPDITSPFEMALLFAIVGAIPLFLMTGTLMMLISGADRMIRGRLPVMANAAVGAGLGALNAIGFLAVGRVIPGDSLKLTANTAATFAPILAVGGIVMSLAMRRRNRD